jgi:hypothetical protein
MRFGPDHCVAGVPVGKGPALNLSRLRMALHCLQGGVRRVAKVHAGHNWVLLTAATMGMIGLV